MQNRASRKVAATMDQAEATKQLLSLSLPEMNYRIWSHDPFLVGSMQVDGRLPEGVTPLDHRRVVPLGSDLNNQLLING